MLGRVLSHLFNRRPTQPAPPPDPVAALVDRARALLGRRDFAEAQKLIDEALRGVPDHLAALVLRAELLRRTGRLDEAMRAYRQILVDHPRQALAWLDLGVCHYLKGEHLSARVFYRFANSLEPDNADVWNELGVVEIALGNFEHAEQSLENAVNRKPDHPEAWNNLGLILARRGALAQARRHFLRATFLRPDYYMALCNLGLVCRELEQFEEAQTALRRACELQPHGEQALVNLGSLQQDLGRLEEALGTLETACAASPSSAEPWTALSALQFRRGELAAAEEAASRALLCDAQSADARLALAHVQLAQLRFAEGWDNYEARADSTQSPLRKLPLPRWSGETKRGVRLLVHGEQGLGDEIMFASCLPDLVAAGANVILECDRRLRGLFSRSFPAIEVVQDTEQYLASEALGPVDCYTPIGSLPRFFRRHEDAFPARAYLVADEARVQAWRSRLDAAGTGNLRVGLAWRGGLAKTGRELRSLPLQALQGLLRLPAVHWVSLQHDADDSEIEGAAAATDTRMSAWRESLRDMDETAGLIQALDLVVSVCSSVVHLAGALGQRVLVLTPRAPAWRYPAEGERMPWYPSVRLFRQSRAGVWDDVLQALARELVAVTCASTGSRA